MPKVIKELKKHIMEEAFKMFSLVGYDKVSMRALAKEVGIAVGTLYNYFPNKEDMYFDILMESWEVTRTRVIEKAQEPLSQDLLKDVIGIIMDDMIARNGLGKEFIHFSSFVAKDEMEALFTDLYTCLEGIYKGLHIPYANRRSKGLIMNIAHVSHHYPNQRNENIDYLSTC